MKTEMVQIFNNTEIKSGEKVDSVVIDLSRAIYDSSSSLQVSVSGSGNCKFELYHSNNYIPPIEIGQSDRGDFVKPEKDFLIIPKIGSTGGHDSDGKSINRMALLEGSGALKIVCTSTGGGSVKVNAWVFLTRKTTK